MTAQSEEQLHSVSRLQVEAWRAWNMSYHVGDAAPYRELARSLYQRDFHARVDLLFARSDAQNALLDALRSADQAGTSEVNRPASSTAASR